MPGMRPRKATCGCDARASSINIEASAASRYSLQNAEKQHGAKGNRRGVEIHPADAPHAQQRRKIDQSVHRGQHDRGQHRLRQVFQQAREEQQAQRERDRGKDKRERRMRPGLVVDGRLRQPAGHGIAMSQGGGEIGRADAEKFLSWVEDVSMFRGEGAGRRDAFDIGEQQAAGRERNDSFDIAQPQRGTLPARQTCRNVPGDRARRAREVRARLQRRSTDATTPSATGCPGKQRSPSRSSTIATMPIASTSKLNLAELPDEQRGPLEEIVSAASNAEQARQLGHGDGQAQRRP